MKVSAPNPVDIAQGLAVHIHSARDQLAPSADSHPLCKTKNYLRVVTTDEACFMVPALKRLFSLRKPLSSHHRAEGDAVSNAFAKKVEVFTLTLLLSLSTQIVFRK